MKATLPVARRFSRFIERLQPRPLELARARNQFLQIRGRLNGSFVVSRIVPIGSHAKGTAVTRISDVDILAVLRRREARWGGGYVGSETFLRRVRDDLVGRYPATAIRRDAQAVVIGFGQGQYRVDVVPAIYHQAAPNGYPIYLIPDGAGDWQESSPEIHRAYFLSQDRRSSGKLRRVVQMLKFWARARGTPFQLGSFHLELVLAASRVAEGVMPYSRIVTLAFELLMRRDGAAFRDPSGVSGLVPAVGTEPQREVVVRALGYTAQHASAAYTAENDGDTAEAIRQWRIVFGEWFPVSAS